MTQVKWDWKTIFLSRFTTYQSIHRLTTPATCLRKDTKYDENHNKTAHCYYLFLQSYISQVLCQSETVLTWKITFWIIIILNHSTIQTGSKKIFDSPNRLRFNMLNLVVPQKGCASIQYVSYNNKSEHVYNHKMWNCSFKYSSLTYH